MKSLSHRLFAQKNVFSCVATLERSAVDHFVEESLDLIFPGMLRKAYHDEADFSACLAQYLSNLENFLRVLCVKPSQTTKILEGYQTRLVEIGDTIKKDATALLEGDPAARSLEEILLCYPGIYAVATYRLANYFWTNDVPILPRLMSEIAHQKTGIDIHPGATIGESFLIDHGTGVVIGETAIIGNSVKIYQGVTLGALSVEKSMAQTKRHPTIEDHCVIYSNATILGGNTVIGRHSVIGGNVWITKSVPSNSLVYHKSEVRLDRIENAGATESSFASEEELSYEI